MELIEKKFMTKKSKLSLALALALFAGNAAAATIEEKIELLQQEIESLKDQVQSKQAGDKAGGAQSLMQNTTVGGYGELHYNNFQGGAKEKDEIDFHRFVLFFGHRFNDWISFKSELELEHSNTENGGAVELEQAYLDFNFSDKINAKAGIFLMPLGFINETHEPPTFFGVERNFIETRIIPSTWWEAGAAIYGEVAPGWKYQAGLTSSLDGSKFENFATKGIREGRRNVSEAPAENIAFAGRLDYTGQPGLTAGVSLFTGKTGQDNVDLNGADARLTLWDAHVRYNKDKLDLRALYAQGHLSDAAELNAAFSNLKSQVAERFYGYYIEAAYHIWQQGDQDFAPFIRYEKWDTQASMPTGTARGVGSNNHVVTVGANYSPHPQVVIKADYQQFDEDDVNEKGDNKGDKRFNLGLGYMF